MQVSGVWQAVEGDGEGVALMREEDHPCTDQGQEVLTTPADTL